jgi:hypothetical protein
MNNPIIAGFLSLMLFEPMAQVNPARVIAPGGVSIAADATNNV